MNVLSIFDGISCGRIALERAGIPVTNYYASEVDKYAHVISNKNYPDIIRLGDVTKWREWDLHKIDLIMAGFPCQAFSKAGKQLGFDDIRGKLFYTLVEILNDQKEKNPDLLFLLENVRMGKDTIRVISHLVGVEPIEINSSLVSAQSRKRLYWTNISNVGQPEDKGILLKDILEPPLILSHRFGEAKPRVYYEKSPTLLVLGSGLPKVSLERIENDDYGRVTLKSGRYRKITPKEMEQLQTLPVGYTEGVSDSQRYKMIGNGWTVDVISHIISNINK